MQETDNNKRLIYLDILNILSIFAVVAMHMNGSVHSLPLNKSWAFSLLVDTLCYFAVPIFVMISGATLMNYRQKYDTKTFFKKKINEGISTIFVLVNTNANLENQNKQVKFKY